MADIDQKVPENVAGRYYVDKTCIDCDLCRETAPANFAPARRRSVTPSSRASPRRPEEEAECVSAMEECPVEAIGIEGEG